MDLKQLRCFVAVAESLHFGRAAGKLRIAQPSLTYQIQRLEEELQTPVLRRTKRRVELTDAGRRLLEEARDILARADRAALSARRTGLGEASQLRVGVGYCMDHIGVSVVVSVFNGRHETVRVELQTMAVPLQFAALRDGRLDVGFVRPPINDASLTGETLDAEPMILALPPKHRLAGKAVLSLAALSNDPFILPPQDAVPIYHDLVLEACRDAGFVPNAPHEADHLQLILGMVSAGGGVALVPASARKMKHFRLAFASLRPAPPDLEIAMAWRGQDTSSSLSKFLDTARRVLGKSRANSARA